MANWTRGQWIVDRAGRETWIDCQTETRIKPIALMYGTPDDAHLIAAAPEMYEALQKAHHEIERLSMVTGYEGEGHFPVLNVIKTALQAAEGK